MNTRYILKAGDGRMVTSDTEAGISLTANPALCYVWTSEEAAEDKRAGYQAILGKALVVVPLAATSGFRF